MGGGRDNLVGEGEESSGGEQKYEAKEGGKSGRTEDGRLEEGVRRGGGNQRTK